MADGPARITAFGDFGITAWTPARKQKMPIGTIGPNEYVRADIVDQMLAALRAVDARLTHIGHMETGTLTHGLVRVAIAKAKGETND